MPAPKPAPDKSTVPKVGDTLFIYDDNYRVYRKVPRGESSGSPIYRESWRPTRVTSETSRSITISHYGKKFAKADFYDGKCPLNILRTTQEVDDATWRNNNVYPLRDHLRTLDTATLKEIARIAGYKERQP